MRSLLAFPGMINSFALIYSRRSISICKTFVGRREKSWIAWINYTKVDSFIHFRRVSPRHLSTTHLEQVCKWAFHTETSSEAFFILWQRVAKSVHIHAGSFQYKPSLRWNNNSQPETMRNMTEKREGKQKAHNGIRRNMASKIVLTSSEARCGSGVASTAD